MTFEGLAILATLIYILKPKFNIALIYLMIGPVYYLALNILPMNYFVAKSQVDRYLNGFTDRWQRYNIAVDRFVERK